MPSGKSNILQLLGLFVAWYAFNAGYNVFNAKLKVFPYPVAISIIQLVVGMIYAFPLWVLGVRNRPKLSLNDLIELFPIALMNAVGHCCTVIAMLQKGGGSFAHVIKASEPVVSVLLALLINGSVPKPLTAISLLPISYGVAYASTLGNLSLESMARELTSYTAILAMIGNVTFALRSILRKNLNPEFKARTNLDANNDHAVSTIYSACLIIPVCAYLEGYESVAAATVLMQSSRSFLQDVFVCGMCFYLYNELQNMVLSSLGPVPTAVGNTLKRVVIFVALYFFTEGEIFPPAKILGCAIAVVGCLVYTLCDVYKL